jgi:hypothetical protein
MLSASATVEPTTFDREVSMSASTHGSATSLDRHANASSDERRKVRADGQHGLADLARRLCGDVRLTPLLADLNPKVPAAGRVAVGLVVVVPSRREARAFAAKMGFTIGFDPKSGNGTGARRKWQAHQSGRPLSALVARPTPMAESPERVAAGMLAGGASPREVAKRLAETFAIDALAPLAADRRLGPIAAIAEAKKLHPEAKRRLAGVRAVLAATRRIGGFRALLNGLARDADAGRSLLRACLVTPALADALLREGQRVRPLLERARAAGTKARGERDGQVVADPEADVLRRLLAALDDGVEMVAGDRIDALGLRAEHDAFATHIERLLTLVDQGVAGLERASVDVLRAVALGGEGRALPKPWPALATLCRDVHAALARVPLTAIDGGLGALLAPTTSIDADARAPSAVIPLAAFSQRATRAARVHDEGEGWARRLAPAVATLFCRWCPSAALAGGSTAARRASRRAAFEAFLWEGEDKANAVDEILAIGASPEIAAPPPSGARRAVGKAGHAALRDVFAALDDAMTFRGRRLSARGRALLCGAAWEDEALRRALERPTGREMLVQHLGKHGGRVLLLAAEALDHR